ncbi:MAG TPA: hypothetical protein VLH38_02645 [Patescibacteria group bacterium]|nr:hypothetical protein [Patescibacteria group bacterium]
MRQQTPSAEQGAQPANAEHLLFPENSSPDFARRNEVHLAYHAIQEALRRQLGPYVAANAVATGVERPVIDPHSQEVPLHRQFEAVMTSMDPGYIEALSGEQLTDPATEEPQLQDFEAIMGDMGEDFVQAASGTELTGIEATEQIPMQSQGV